MFAPQPRSRVRGNRVTASCGHITEVVDVVVLCHLLRVKQEDRATLTLSKLPRSRPSGAKATMAELTTTKLEPDSHLLLDQPLLRLPNELLRKNLKSAQRQIEMTNKNVTSAIQASNNQSPADTLASLDATLVKAQNLKRKLEALQTEEKSLHRQQKARIRHLQELHEIPSLADVNYDNWSRTRLDRLLVDYLLRQGYTQSARELAREKNIEELVDVGVFEECGKIEQSLREGRTQECLAWCGENKQALKKINVRSISVR